LAALLFLSGRNGVGGLRRGVGCGWASYLDEITEVEAWMFEGEGPPPIAALADALGKLQMAS
jgi:hypothetical protein